MEIIIYIMEVIIAYFILGYIHELGHVLMGVYHGWEFQLLVLGPIGFKREDGKIKCYLEKDIVLWAGVGGSMPKEDKEENIDIWKKTLLAGSMASIIFGLITLLLALHTQILFIILLSFMSIGMGVACLIPGMKTGLLYSDGGRFFRLKKGGQGAREEIALFRLSLLFNIEDGLSKVSYDDIDALLKSKDLTIIYYGHYSAYRYFKLKGNNEEAKHQILKMKELENKVPKVIVNSYPINESESI